MRFEEQFFHAEKYLSARSQAAILLAKDRAPTIVDARWRSLSDLIDFFQSMAAMARYTNADLVPIYKTFFYWYSSYWIASKSLIDAMRAESWATWEDADWLFERMCALDRRLNSGQMLEFAKDNIDGFLEWETSQLT